MSGLRYLMLPLVMCTLFAGCSDGTPVVIVDERSEAEIQQELEDYDKKQAEEAANYEKQQSGN